MGDDFRDARRLVDLGDPFRQRREHLAVIDFLERVPAGVAVWDLADEQQQRRAVLHRHMNTDCAVASAGTAGDHRRRRPSGQLAVCVGHVDRAGLKPAGHQFQLLPLIEQSIQRVEEALAGNLEHMVDALRDERIRQHSPAMARRDTCRACPSQFHANYSVARRRIGERWRSVTSTVNERRLHAWRHRPITKPCCECHKSTTSRA